MSIFTDAGTVLTLLKTFEEAAAVARHFGEREGERELRIEEFAFMRGEGYESPPPPEMVKLAWALTHPDDDTPTKEGWTPKMTEKALFYEELAEEHEEDRRELAGLVTQLAQGLVALTI